MNERLYIVEHTLEQIMDQGAAAELEGDTEAAAAFYRQLETYLTKEAAKVTSYVGLIRSREATARQCNDEIERLQNIRASAVADVDRLKANALAVMQQFGVRELKATPGGGLRIQGNGGKEPLEVQPVEIPDELQKAIVTMPFSLWADICREMPRSLLARCTESGTLQEKREPDTERIREALVRGESVPGAKLLERGEHLRVL
jgi:hypothetical protein